MTDLEKLQRAKDYIYNLANGIDPISGAELPQDTALNNVRLARCFFYVAGVLQQVIENGGQVGGRQRKAAKLPFAIARSEIDEVTISEALPISHFCKRIGEAAHVDDKNMKPLSHRTITDWLVQKGFLYVQETPAGKKKRVTGTGKELGLYEEERVGQYGNYLAVYYDKNAQQFILDNLETILIETEA